MSVLYYSLHGEQAIETYCEPVYESKGANSYNLCREGVGEARNESQAQQYADYLISGGTRDYKGWKRQRAGQTISGLALTTLGSLFGTKETASSTSQTSVTDADELRRLAEESRKKTQKNLIIGVSVLAVLTTVGIILYKKYGK